MNKEREILEDIIYDISWHSVYQSMEGQDEAIEKILKKFELKRKKLPVKIMCIKGNPSPEYDNYSAVWDDKELGIFSTIRYETKQQAIDFCTEHGFEIVEG